MKTFEEWLDENRPELVNENWQKSLGSFALGAASFLPMSNTQAAPPSASRSAIAQSISQNQQARMVAMKRVSNVHRFKKNWGSDFGSKEEQKLFDAILKLQTEQDHDHFLKKLSKDKENAIHYRMQGKYHPNKDIEKSEKRKIINSYDFQYMDYVKAIALASKLNL